MSFFQRLFRPAQTPSSPRAAASTRTWRGIQQASKRSPASQPARQYHVQKLLRLWLGLLVGATAIVAVGYGIVFVREQTERVGAMTPPVALREIVFSTDGVLTGDWAREILDDPIGQPMANIQLASVKASLESHQQILRAQVALQFPDRLQITIEERLPLLKARVRARDGSIQEILFARDGVSYTGRNYPATMVTQLPLLAGVRLQRHPDGTLAPVAGLESVEALLRAARELTPELVADWRAISLERFRGGADAAGSLLVVRGHQIPEVVFQPSNFNAQLVQLSRIVTYAQQAGNRSFQRIDLSFGEQAYVTWQTTGPLAGGARSPR